MFKLRDYQQESVDAVYNSTIHGHHSIVVQSPPRTGKTVIMADIARRATAKGNQVTIYRSPPRNPGTSREYV
ncbi:hypothetical protein KB1253_09530 [Lactiplantibacillus plantarum]|nr:hypothetical protein KB1253_09530 [Lactiplantibacillus plantarum]